MLRDRYANIFSLLQGLRWTSDVRGASRCPAHEDSNPSLSILVKDDRLLLKCWAGCTVSNICEVLGIKTKDLHAPDAEAKRKVVAVYDYHGADGRVVYQKVRFDPKSFAFRKNDKDWSTEGVKKVLYRLPGILSRPGGSKGVLICEGEKDADIATKLGFAGTTAPDATRWEEEYTLELLKYPVAIIPHNDKPGYEHAYNVAESFDIHGKKIRVVHLPEAGAGGDLESWYQQRVSEGLDVAAIRARLLDLIRLSPLYADTPQEQLAVELRRMASSIRRDCAVLEAKVKELTRCAR